MAYYLFNFTKKGANKGTPLRDQAAKLLTAKLWGIGDKTANRELLAPGDFILAYVGAPERLFIGHGVLSSKTHPWTSAEAERYPEPWGAGVAFAAAEVWKQPVPIKSVWESMPSSGGNPNAHFFGGVVRIKKEDYDCVLAAAGADQITPPKPANTTSKDETRSGDNAIDRLYASTERLKQYLAKPSPKGLSEDATRAHFINRYLEALGYADFNDIDYGVPVDSGDFADYVLKVGGQNVVVLEAKKLGAQLGAKEAAQVVKYASVLGVRWGLVTDGRILRVYDPRVPNVTPEHRLVFELDLAGYQTREDFEVLLYPDLSLLSKESMRNGTPLERRAAREAIRELLTTPGSNALGSLRSELKDKKLIQFSDAELADVVAELLD